MNSPNLKRTFFIALCIGTVSGCFSESIDPMEEPNPDPDPVVVNRQESALAAYDPCTSDAECGELECVDILGQQVCAETGCADGTACAGNETCIVSDAIDPSGVCAHTGSAEVCGRACADPLRCGLDPECISAGCCGTMNEDGCPEVCASIEAMTCDIDPRCPTECCVHEFQ